MADNENITSGKIRLQGRTIESKDTGQSITEIYVGPKEDLLGLQEDLDFRRNGINGKPVSAKLNQISPEIWQLEVRAEKSTGGELTIHPDFSYGRKSQTLKGSLIQLPLEKCDNYKACWNHYLMSKDGSVPGWADTAESVNLSQSDAKNYCWVESLDAVSKEPDSNGKIWVCVQEPTKPGVTHVDFATYTITESVRCRSAKQAAEKCKSKLNQIGSPEEGCMGLTYRDWTWKCDDATVSWSGKYWLATLSYTLADWDDEMYD